MVGLLLFLPIPVQAANPLTETEANAIAKAVGCEAPVSVVESDKLNGYFFRSWFGAGIVVYAGPEVNPDSSRAVLLHELGHCIQYQDGTLRGDWPWVEWDADEFAIRNAHVAGLRPDANFLALMGLWNRPGRDNYESDKPHGSDVARSLFNQHQIRRLHPNLDFQGV